MPSNEIGPAFLFPSGKSRIADWELFGKKIHSGIKEGLIFRFILDKMNEEKDKFSIEDDPLFVILKRIIIEQGGKIEAMSASELYIKLCEKAEEMKMRDFGRRYRNPISIGKRLANIKDELQRVFELNITIGSNNIKLYSIAPRGSDEDEELFSELEGDEEYEPGWQG